jgi:hypothetical protein
LRQHSETVSAQQIENKMKHSETVAKNDGNCFQKQNKTLRQQSTTEKALRQQSATDLFFLTCCRKHFLFRSAFRNNCNCIPQQLQQFQSVLKNMAKTVWKHPENCFILVARNNVTAALLSL